LIATNTMHIVFDEVQRAVRMPLLSIIDATAESIRAAGLRSVGLLGTVFTMRERFFRQGLAHAGLEVLVPPPEDQDRMNHVIYEELCRGRITPDSRKLFLRIIEHLRKEGAQGIVRGCTEIPLLIQPPDSALPLFNTTLLHARKALDFAVQPVMEDQPALDLKR
jgi:aspartate racemase